VAQALGRADVGQTVVVKDGHVLALEAVEGTDAAIRRGAALGGRGVVVVKRSKPGQDERFDLPAVGPATIAVLAEVGAAVLAVEAGRRRCSRPRRCSAMLAGRASASSPAERPRPRDVVRSRVRRAPGLPLAPAMRRVDGDPPWRNAMRRASIVALATCLLRGAVALAQTSRPPPSPLPSPGVVLGELQQ
jgi:hypothetical protein